MSLLKYPPTLKLPPPPPKKFYFPWLFFIAVVIWSFIVWDSITPHLPKPDSPPKLYSNQCKQDIQATFLSAIRGATNSIHLVMFGLSDKPILSALSQKIKENVNTSIYYDMGGSPNIFRYLQGGSLHPIKNKGLMHQKILILDHETIFISSANMTSPSLRMHDNLVVGLVSSSLAKFLEEHEPFSPGYFNTKVGGQDVELWLLPDPCGSALSELKEKIRKARHSIRIALFTLTHQGLVEEIINAHKRGVSVSVLIDKNSGLGASSKAVKKLKINKVPVHLSKGIQLLHHKFIYIDEITLVTGSANWTKAAFYKNSDCILSLNHLNPEQRKFMNKLWHSLKTLAEM